MSSPRPLGAMLRRVAPALAAASLGASLLAVPVAPGAAAADGPAAREAAARSEVTIVQANVPMRLGPEQFAADLRTIYSAKPDFITFNEVERRYDSVIAPPPSYAVHRDPKNRYTAATAVAWNTERWTEVDSGTVRVSNYREIPPGWHGLLGLRFANWVTLRSTEGRTLSVVSAHVAPLARKMPDLLRPSVERIGTLVEKLAPRGPVLVGGDFNVHYKSGRYPRDLFAAAQMVPTYDGMGGKYFPTGDHQGATVDYVFNRGGGQLVIEQQSKKELNSDHDAVIAGYGWRGDLPSQTVEVVSDPEARGEARRRAVLAMLSTVRGATAGESLDVVSAALGLRRVYGALRDAMERGVAVRLVTRSKQMTAREERLADLVSARRAASGSSVTRCREACLTAGRRAGVPRTLVLLNDTAGRATTRVDLNRNLTTAMVQRRTRVVTRTGSLGLAQGRALVDSVS